MDCVRLCRANLHNSLTNKSPNLSPAPQSLSIWFGLHFAALRNSTPPSDWCDSRRWWSSSPLLCVCSNPLWIRWLCHSVTCCFSYYTQVTRSSVIALAKSHLQARYQHVQLKVDGWLGKGATPEFYKLQLVSIALSYISPRERRQFFSAGRHR